MQAVEKLVGLMLKNQRPSPLMKQRPQKIKITATRDQQVAPFSPFTAVSRMIIIGSLERLLAMNGVDRNAWRRQPYSFVVTPPIESQSGSTEHILITGRSGHER